jgi:hypothetical protein
MRFSTLNVLDGESLGYFGFHFHLDYTVTWVTTQGSRFHKYTHRYVYLCFVQNSVIFFHIFFRYIIQIKERFYLTSLIFFAFLNAA